MSDRTPTQRTRPQLTVRDLASLVSGDVVGDPAAVISGVSSIDEAEVGDIVFAENPRFLSQAQKSRASAIVAFLDATTPDKPLIKVENPRYAFAKILELFTARLDVSPGVHPTAVLGQNVTIGENASIGPHVTIADGASIGARAILLHGCYIGHNVIIEDDCVLHANVAVYANSKIGKRSILHAGVVVGADGFGYMPVGDRNIKVPHVGNVEIGEDVEIGANTTIDRGKTGATIIGDRTKIDNLVQIAHNVRIGADSIVVSQAGIAGSVTIGERVRIAGQAGLRDHITIGDGSLILGQAGVFGDVPPGSVYSGYPARPHRHRMRVEAITDQLPEYRARWARLEQANKDLQERNARLEKLVALLAERVGVNPDSIE